MTVDFNPENLEYSIFKTSAPSGDIHRMQSAEEEGPG